MKWSLRVAVWMFSMALPVDFASAQDNARLKVAEGAYVMEMMSEGEKMRYHEDWILWSTSQGNFQVESGIRCDIGDNKFVLQSEMIMNAGLRPLTLRLQGELPGLKGVNELRFAFGENGIRYSAAGKEYEEEIQGPSYMFLPFPWFLNVIAIRTTMEKNRDIPLQLVAIGDATELPLDLVVFHGKIRFEGTEQIKMEGQIWDAHRVEFLPEPYDPVTIWLSSEGLLLALQDAKMPEQRIELRKFRKYRDFSYWNQASEK